MEADGSASTKTREGMEGTATAEQAKRGKRFSACRFEPGPKPNSTNVGMMAEPPALPCRDDVLVENGDESPKSCFQSLEMRSPSAAGGLVPTGKTSTATETTFNQSPLRFYMTEETYSKMDPEENSKDKNYGFQFHSPSTTAASGNCFLPPQA